MRFKARTTAPAAIPAAALGGCVILLLLATSGCRSQPIGDGPTPRPAGAGALRGATTGSLSATTAPPSTAAAAAPATEPTDADTGLADAAAAGIGPDALPDPASANPAEVEAAAAAAAAAGAAGAVGSSGPLLALSDDVGCDGTTLMSVVMMNQELTTVQSALRVAGLQSRLNDDRLNLTFFAPTNKAIATFAADSGISPEALLADPMQLRHLLLYHLIPAPVPPELLAVTPVFNTSWVEQNIFVPQPFQGVVSGESGTTARISRVSRVCGSWLYVISYVLLPGPSLDDLPPFLETVKPPTNASAVGNATKRCNPGGTALDVLRSTPDLSYTLSAIDTALMTRLFNNASSQLTLLAPVDDAWREGALRLQLATPEDILGQSPAILRALVWAHVIPRNLPPARLQSGMYTTQAGVSAPPVSISAAPGNVTIQTPTTDARVTHLGLGDACNAAVYIIDRLLIPSQLPEPLLVLPVPTDKRKRRRYRRAAS